MEGPVIRVFLAVVYVFLLFLILPALRKDFQRFKEEFLEFQTRTQDKGLTIFDAWKKRYYLPEMTDVSFREQVKRIALASILLIALLGLLVVGLGFIFDLPPDRAILAPLLGGLLMFTLGTAISLCFSFIKRLGMKRWKPLEPTKTERGIPSKPPLEPFPMKPWLVLSLVTAMVAFFAASSTSYFFLEKVDWSTSAAIAFGIFLGSILMRWLMRRK